MMFNYRVNSTISLQGVVVGSMSVDVYAPSSKVARRLAAALMRSNLAPDISTLPIPHAGNFEVSYPVSYSMPDVNDDVIQFDSEQLLGNYL